MTPDPSPSTLRAIRGDDGTITFLREVKREPVADVVCVLEELLRRAQEGEILGIAVAAAMVESRTAHQCVVGKADIAHLVTAIERVKLRLLQE
jgi:hypothetical protein